ncbi:TPA_asm: hypothetical protein HUJ06_031957 [Nelumbo nucifera]|uniref:Uncharacterized protein n=1 Tax=Nelumbo nucifera TaxID=4432 RepID=A0A822ZYF1_NELNU|nr:TPA_asm: hypothetical protein HUJ06_031957 [Nelumbo nucifera]
MHGGLSPDLKNLDQIWNIACPVDVPDQGLLCDLLWADPDKDIQGWGENDREVPDRAHQQGEQYSVSDPSSSSQGTILHACKGSCHQ